MKSRGSSMITRIKLWASRLKSNIAMLYLAYQHKRTPWYAKFLAILTVGYALSPIDLIPDFIPILGFVDDAMILPALIWLSLKLIPSDVKKECTEAAKDIFSNGRPKNYVAAGVMILIWVCVIAAIVLKFIK